MNTPLKPAIDAALAEIRRYFIGKGMDPAVVADISPEFFLYHLSKGLTNRAIWGLAHNTEHIFDASLRRIA